MGETRVDCCVLLMLTTPPRVGPLLSPPHPVTPRLPLCIVVRVNFTTGHASLHRLCSRPGISGSIGRAPRSASLYPDAELAVLSEAVAVFGYSRNTS